MMCQWSSRRHRAHTTLGGWVVVLEAKSWLSGILLICRLSCQQGGWEGVSKYTACLDVSSIWRFSASLQPSWHFSAYCLVCRSSPSNMVNGSGSWMEAICSGVIVLNWHDLGVFAATSYLHVIRQDECWKIQKAHWIRGQEGSLWPSSLTPA